MEKFFVYLGIIVVLLLAINDTIKTYKSTESIAITTPAQENMRTPSRQNPGQRQMDIETIKLRNRQSDQDWSKNPNNNSNKNDNFNRNRDRSNLRQYLKQNSQNEKDSLDFGYGRNN